MDLVPHVNGAAYTSRPLHDRWQGIESGEMLRCPRRNPVASSAREPPRIQRGSSLFSEFFFGMPRSGLRRFSKISRSESSLGPTVGNTIVSYRGVAADKVADVRLLLSRKPLRSPLCGQCELSTMYVCVRQTHMRVGHTHVCTDDAVYVCRTDTRANPEEVLVIRCQPKTPSRNSSSAPSTASTRASFSFRGIN